MICLLGRLPQRIVLVLFSVIAIIGLKREVSLLLFYSDLVGTMPRSRHHHGHSDSSLISARDKALHDPQRRGSDLKQLHRRDVIANGQRARPGYCNKQIQVTLAVKKRSASIGQKKTMSIQGGKASISHTPNRYCTNTKAIKDM